MIHQPPGRPHNTCPDCGGRMTLAMAKVRLRSATVSGETDYDIDEAHFECSVCRDAAAER